MANTDRPSGFKPHGKVRKTRRMVAGATIYPGDAVTLSDDGKMDPATAGGAVFGVALDYATDGGSINISCDPEQEYVVQCSAAEVNAQTFVGNVADLVATAGDSTYRTSRMELNSAVAAAGGSQQFVILGLKPSIGNSFGGFANVIVKVNEPQVNGNPSFAGI